MERSPLISWVFHLRAVSLLLSLLAVDAFFVRRSWISLTTRGPSVEIVFGLEVGKIEGLGGGWGLRGEDSSPLTLCRKDFWK